jgi:hypothetical protein
MEKQRTSQQNKSIHKYFQEVAQELNESGITLDVLLSGLEVDITPHVVKDIFRKIGSVKFGIKSTADLTTKQIQECWEEFNRHLSRPEIAVHVPFPSFEAKNFEEYYRDVV